MNSWNPVKSGESLTTTTKKSPKADVARFKASTSYEAIRSLEDVDPDCWEALPEEIRAELKRDLERQQQQQHQQQQQTSPSKDWNAIFRGAANGGRRAPPRTKLPPAKTRPAASAFRSGHQVSFSRTCLWFLVT